MASFGLINKQKSIVVFMIISLFILIPGCALESKAWQKSLDANTIGSYNEYLDNYPQGSYVNEAYDKLDDLYWENALKDDTIESYSGYLEKTENGKNTDEANARIYAIADESAWLEAWEVNTVEIYKGYMEEFTNGKYINEAGSKIFSLSITTIGSKMMTQDEVEQYYKDVCMYAPEEVKTPLTVLSNNWEEIHYDIDRNKKIQLALSEELKEAAEEVWEYTEKRFNKKCGVYIEAIKVKPVFDIAYDRDVNVDLYLESFTRKLLDLTDFIVMEEGAENHNAILEVKVRLTPGGDYYTDNRWHWTSATIKGAITFSIGDQETSWSISSREGPFSKIYEGTYMEPESAPFEQVSEKGFEPVIIKALGDLEGAPFLINLLDNNNIPLNFPDDRIRIKIIAINALGDKKDETAIEPLVAIYSNENENEDLRKAAESALKKLGWSDQQP